jgi:hypothetical protein
VMWNRDTDVPNPRYGISILTKILIGLQKKYI